MGTLKAVFDPVGPVTGGDNASGTVFYHITLVYSDANGSQFVSGGPTIPNSTVGAEGAAIIAHGAVANSRMVENTPSVWGTLRSQSGSFNPGDLQRGIDVVPTYDDHGKRNPDAGTALPSQVLSNNISAAQFSQIVSTMNSIGSLNLTYAPWVQNSNSMACTALTNAGIATPSSTWTKVLPGCGLKLPTNQTELQIRKEEWRNNMVPNYNLLASTDGSGMEIVTLDSLRPGEIDFRYADDYRTGSGRWLEVENSDGSNVTVIGSGPLTTSYSDIDVIRDGLEIQIFGDNNTIDGGTYSDFDIIGYNNNLYAEYSHADLYGSGNLFAGPGSNGGDRYEYYEWDWGLDDDWEGRAANSPRTDEESTPAGRIITAQRDLSTGEPRVDTLGSKEFELRNLSNPAKLIESMASFTSASSAGLITRPSGQNAELTLAI